MVTCTQQHDYVGVLLSGGPAGVVQEVVLGQHLEHVVSAALQEGGPCSLHLARRDVAELEVALLPPGRVTRNTEHDTQGTGQGGHCGQCGHMFRLVPQID